MKPRPSALLVVSHGAGNQREIVCDLINACGHHNGGSFHLTASGEDQVVNLDAVRNLAPSAALILLCLCGKSIESSADSELRRVERLVLEHASERARPFGVLGHPRLVLGATHLRDALHKANLVVTVKEKPDMSAGWTDIAPRARFIPLFNVNSDSKLIAELVRSLSQQAAA